jgi:hypothetical protein
VQLKSLTFSMRICHHWFPPFLCDWLELDSWQIKGGFSPDWNFTLFGVNLPHAQVHQTHPKLGIHEGSYMHSDGLKNSTRERRGNDWVKYMPY